MKLVIDANIIFAAIIRDGKTAELLVDNTFQLYTPEYILFEIENHKEEITRKAGKTNEHINGIIANFHKIITIIPQIEIQEFLEQAKKITPDICDIMYFALALKLNCPIWSNDAALKNQKEVQIYSTAELMQLA